MDERPENDVPETTAAAPPRDYSDLGERVASVLNAAEQAAEQIRADAQRTAEALRRDAEAEARAHADERRREAESDAERRISAAVGDAEAIRDTARAAAQRIAEEGQRRLGELREDARALEARFGEAIDDLRDLVSQLEEVVLSAGGSARDLRSEQPAEPATREPELELSDAIWPSVSGQDDTPFDGEPAERPAGSSADPSPRP